MQERVNRLCPAFQGICQPAVGRLNLSDDPAARIRQIAQGSGEFLLGSRQGRAGCLQTVDGGRYARLKKVLSQTLAQELCNLLRIKTGFNFAG